MNKKLFKKILGWIIILTVSLGLLSLMCLNVIHKIGFFPFVLISIVLFFVLIGILALMWKAVGWVSGEE